MSASVFVRNVPYDATPAALENHARQFGEVVNARIPIDHETGNARGFAFVNCASDDDALAVLRGLDRSVLMGRTLFAEPAQDQSPAARAPKGYLSPAPPPARQ